MASDKIDQFDCFARFVSLRIENGDWLVPPRAYLTCSRISLYIKKFEKNRWNGNKNRKRGVCFQKLVLWTFFFVEVSRKFPVMLHYFWISRESDKSDNFHSHWFLHRNQISLRLRCHSYSAIWEKKENWRRKNLFPLLKPMCVCAYKLRYTARYGKYLSPEGVREGKKFNKMQIITSHQCLCAPSAAALLECGEIMARQVVFYSMRGLCQRTDALCVNQVIYDFPLHLFSRGNFLLVARMSRYVCALHSLHNHWTRIITLTIIKLPK